MPVQTGGGTEGVCKRTDPNVGMREADFNVFTGYCPYGLDAVDGLMYI